MIVVRSTAKSMLSANGTRALSTLLAGTASNSATVMRPTVSNSAVKPCLGHFGSSLVDRAGAGTSVNMSNMQRFGSSQKTFFSNSASDINRNNRDFSTAAAAPPSLADVVQSISTDSDGQTNERQLGTVTRTLAKLDMNAVKKIEAELEYADVTRDGRLDHDDLKNLLKKHTNTFTDEEIVEFAELFYAGKAGGSVSFQDFIVALDNAASGTDRHPILDGNCSVEYIYRKSHATYTPEELDIKLTHVEPKGFLDKTALNAVRAVRFVFDTATGWNNSSITTEKILNRVIFLETIAAVPGMVAAICRHFKSLRNMERDGGLLHLFLEEANNERMHLLSFIKMKDPSMAFRAAVVFSQFGFGGAFLLSYLASPKFCHRFVGYIEEEACLTYTKIIEAIEKAPEGSELAGWRNEVAPNIARSYWHLGEKGTVLDLMYAVRADEAEHRDVNHAASQLRHGDINPWGDPDIKLNLMLKRYVNDIMSRDDDIAKLKCDPKK